jgi:glucose-6-phosphate 1-dehydrogenase
MLILGATGDLTFRYILAALAQLREAGRLPEGFRISTLARDDLDTGSYRAHAKERLARHAAALSEEARSGIAEAIEYHRADVADPERVRAALAEAYGEPVVAYLALPPSVFGRAIEALKKVGLAEGSRVVVEKPFGENLEMARDLNRLLHEAYPDEAVFRVDHFLGLQTVQNVLGLRFANRVFEPVWNHDHVETPTKISTRAAIRSPPAQNMWISRLRTAAGGGRH